MTGNFLVFVLILCLVLVPRAHAQPHRLLESAGAYNYSLKGADWGGSCVSSQQSPIDLSATQASCSDSMVFDLKLASSMVTTAVVDNGYTYQLDGEFSQLYATDTSNVLLGYIGTGMFIHAPSEHTIQGVSYDAELQIVHKIADQFASDSTDARTVAIVSILFKVDNSSEPNPFFTALALGNLTNETQETNIKLDSLLSPQLASPLVYFTYKGSLTAPPCTESVNWYVLQQILTIPGDQLAHLTSRWAANETFAKGIGNNRVIQSLNERTIQISGNSCQTQYVYYFSFFILFIFVAYFIFKLL